MERVIIQQLILQQPEIAQQLDTRACRKTKNARRPPPSVLLGEELVPGVKRAAERDSGRTRLGGRDSSEAGALPQHLRYDSLAPAALRDGPAAL